MSGWVNHLLLHSFVDGPGNRAVVFLQGCNLHCLYCHNPYTISLCNSCGMCVDTCPSGALSFGDERVLWDAKICTQCDTCIETCPNNASPKALWMLASELCQAIRPASAFISGVTVSGGEPSLQAEFVNEFFGALKSTWPRLTTLIETNGSAGPQAYLPLLTNLDLAIVDLKASHPQRYTELTGGQLEPTLETIRFLHREKKLYSVQQVIVPGFTDTEEGVAETARLLAEIDPHIRLKLLRFRSHGTFGPASEWPSPAGEVMDRLVQVAIDHGLAQVERSL